MTTSPSLVLSPDQTIDGPRGDLQYLTDLGVGVPHPLQDDGGPGSLVGDTVEPFLNTQSGEGHLAGVLWRVPSLDGVVLEARQVL
jgi:hypothetical protein